MVSCSKSSIAHIHITERGVEEAVLAIDERPLIILLCVLQPLRYVDFVHIKHMKECRLPKLFSYNPISPRIYIFKVTFTQDAFLLILVLHLHCKKGLIN